MKYINVDHYDFFSGFLKPTEFKKVSNDNVMIDKILTVETRKKRNIEYTLIQLMDDYYIQTPIKASQIMKMLEEA